MGPSIDWALWILGLAKEDNPVFALATNKPGPPFCPLSDFRQAFPREELHRGSNGTRPTPKDLFFPLLTSPAARLAGAQPCQPRNTPEVWNTRRTGHTVRPRERESMMPLNSLAHLTSPESFLGCPPPPTVRYRTNQRTSDSSSPMRAKLGPHLQPAFLSLPFYSRQRQIDSSSSTAARSLPACPLFIERVKDGQATLPLAHPPSWEASCWTMNLRVGMPKSVMVCC